MGDAWVVNSSPLILLGKIGRIDLLMRLASKVVIPEGVAAELRSGPSEDTARVWIECEGASMVKPVPQADPIVASWDLGLGETHVLSLCRTLPNAVAILDDRAARNCAVSMGIRFTGTLGLIALAKRRRLIAEVKPLLDHLIQQGIRLDAATVAAALRLSDE